jgi:hypothetical protein
MQSLRDMSWKEDYPIVQGAAMAKKYVWVAMGLIFSVAGAWSMPSYARNEALLFSIADALNDPALADRRPPNDVAFYFANQQPPKPGTSLGEVELKTKRSRTGVTDEYNCRLALLAVLNGLHDKAVKAGGNAVGNIVSYYKQQISGTDTQYQCNAGASGGVVWLKGTILKVAP